MVVTWIWRPNRIAERKTRRAFLRTGFQAQQLTLNKTPWLTGPVKRSSKYFSTGGQGGERRALRAVPTEQNHRSYCSAVVGSPTGALSRAVGFSPSYDPAIRCLDVKTRRTE
jgi:hypothetical protein